MKNQEEIRWKGYYHRLIGVGQVPAIFVEQLKIGDVVVWNYGSTSKVVGIKEITKKTVEITFEWEDEFDGHTETSTRRMRKNSLITTEDTLEEYKKYKDQIELRDIKFERMAKRKMAK